MEAERSKVLNEHQQRIVETLMVPAAKIASKLCGGDEEAVSVAYIALCESITKYDPTKGASEKTYCLRRVRGAVLDYIEERMGKRKKNTPRLISNAESISCPDTGLQRVEFEDLLTVLRPPDREIFREFAEHKTPVSAIAT